MVLAVACRISMEGARILHRSSTTRQVVMLRQGLIDADCAVHIRREGTRSLTIHDNTCCPMV